MTRARAILTILALLGCLLLPAGTAVAATVRPAIPTGTDCLRPPTAESPTGGGAGYLDPGPERPVEGDPFDPNSGATLYDVYGYAGFGAHMYDPGCLSVAKVWDAANDSSNALAAIAAITIALTVRGVRLVTDGSIGSLWDPLQQEGQRILGGGLFVPFLFLGALVTGLYILSRSRRADIAGESRASGAAALILLAGFACATYSMTVGATIDRGVGESFKAANTLATQTVDGGQRDPADAVAANLVSSVLYESWAARTFGPGPAAAEFGPDLYRAGALTRAEQAQIDADPASATRILDAKQADYKRVAKQVEEKYPQAYQVLAGNDTGHRLQHAILGVASALAACGYLLLCLVKMLWGMVVVRVGIGVAPVIAIIAQFPRWQQLALDLLGWVVEALVKAVAFGFVFAVFLAGGIGTIMDPALDWHPWVKVVVLLFAVFALQSLLKRMGLIGRTWQFGGKHEPMTRPNAGEAARTAGTEVAARAGAEAVARGPAAARAGAARAAAGTTRAAGAVRPVVYATNVRTATPAIAGAAARAAAPQVARAALTTGATGGLAAPAAITTAGVGTAVTVARAGRAAQTVNVARRGASSARAAGNAVASMATRRVDPARVATVTSLPPRTAPRVRYSRGTLPGRTQRPALPPPPPPTRRSTP